MNSDDDPTHRTESYSPPTGDPAAEPDALAHVHADPVPEVNLDADPELLPVDPAPAPRRPPPPRPPRPREPRTWPIFLGVLTLFAIAGMLVYFFGPGSDLRPFRSHLAEYASTDKLKHVYSPPPGIVGKVVIIDADRIRVDPLSFRLPADLRPGRHADVGTVVIHRKQPEKEFGHYTDVQLAFVQVWRLVLIDRASGTLYHWIDVDGPPPRAAVQENEGNQIGPPPVDAIIDAIANLPRLATK